MDEEADLLLVFTLNYLFKMLIFIVLSCGCVMTPLVFGKYSREISMYFERNVNYTLIYIYIIG